MKDPRHLGVLALVLAAAALQGCEGTSGSARLDSLELIQASQVYSVGPRGKSDPWEKQRWIEKVARALRGQGIGPGDSMDELLKLPEDQIVDRFMADPRFAETILSFNLYFLGGRVGSVRDDAGRFVSQVTDFPAAIGAAQAVAQNQGGDFSQLLKLDQPFYLTEVTPYPISDDDAKRPVTERFKDRVAAVQKDLDAMIALVGTPGYTHDAFCKLVNGHVSTLFSTGLPIDMFLWMELAPGWYGYLIPPCVAPVDFGVDPLVLLNQIKAIDAKFFERLGTFVHDTPVAHPSILDLKPFRVDDLGIKARHLGFSGRLAQDLPNSSTNYDRKRAAYVLSRYFCDDLTPINVVAPDDHAGNRHASDPSCQACHYKLDPMAGFFRNYGVQFFDFSKSPLIVFDDMARAQRDAYESAWKASASSGRTWEVGYIRSSNDPSLNDYGDSLDDLYAIIGKAPEVRKCMVKRMFDFFVSDDQAVDAGYLEGVSNAFIEQSKADPVAALKAAIKKLVLSRTFREPDPQTDQCYDYPQGFDPRNAPPCRVAYVLQKNCASCHGPTSTKGGLDVTKWVEVGDGTRDFLHLDDDGKQVPARETLEAIVDRLSTTDATRRMPLKKFIPGADRETIYLWAQEELKRLPARRSP